MSSGSTMEMNSTHGSDQTQLPQLMDNHRLSDHPQLTQLMDNRRLSGLDKNLRCELILFGFQIFLICIVIVVSLYNLSYEKGNQQLWIVIMTSSLGYLMPNPRVKLDVDQILRDYKTLPPKNNI